MHWPHDYERGDAMHLAPRKEVAGSVCIGAASVWIADRRGEKFTNPSAPDRQRL